MVLQQGLCHSLVVQISQLFTLPNESGGHVRRTKVIRDYVHTIEDQIKLRSLVRTEREILDSNATAGNFFRFARRTEVVDSDSPQIPVHAARGSPEPAAPSMPSPV